MSLCTRLATTLPALVALAACTGPAAAPDLSPDSARAIARDAYIYGFPLVDNYRIVHAYFVDSAGREYRGPMNAMHSAANVFTPADKAVQTPNSDTPYSFAGLDLRAEPMVLTLPAIEKDRYYSVQLVDAYTHNFAYLGTRTTGNGGGSFLVAGPGWKGERPEGIDAVLAAETDLVLAIIRTQLFSPADLDAVRGIQAGYRLQPLSAFRGTAAPPAPAPLAWRTPLSVAAQRSDPAFFAQLNAALAH
ncbi:MAG: DUF1254 domain-containing protein, partial [Gemmatimonadales bacterium]|nr:DUF1254 domain-containing protein [Gemmatimonadales bacterium]